MNEGEYKPGDRIESEEFFVVQRDQVGYTIDYTGDNGVIFELVVVWENEKLRDRIVELLNKYGEKD